jgi:hypothetical protein
MIPPQQFPTTQQFLGSPSLLQLHQHQQPQFPLSPSQQQPPPQQQPRRLRAF